MSKKKIAIQGELGAYSHIAVENLLSNLQMMSQVPSLQSNIVLARSKKYVCTRNWQTFYQLRSRSG